MSSSKLSQEERQKLKQRAVQYFKENDVPARMETLLNKMFHEQPADIYGYTARYFTSFARPATYSKFVLEEAIGSTGLTAICVSTYCTMNGVEEFIAKGEEVNIQHPVVQMAFPTGPQQAGAAGKKSKQQTPAAPAAAAAPNESSTTDKTAGDEASSQQGTTVPDQLAAHQLVLETVVLPELAGKDPRDYSNISHVLSNLLKKTDEDGQLLLQHECHLAVCLAALKTASILRHCPPHQCLVTATEEDEPRSLPGLMIPVIAGGFLSAGKLRWKEFYLVTGNSADRSLIDTVQLISSIYQHLAAIISEKFGLAATSIRPESGAFVPPVDKPDQVVELLSEAACRSGASLGNEVFIAANVSAVNLYDVDKMKYEILAGQWKNSTDAMGQLADLVSSNSPALAMLIDPLQDKAPEDWKSLQERVGKTCVLAGQGSCRNLSVEDILSNVQAELSPTCIVNFKKTPVPLDLIDIIKQLQENGPVIFSCLELLTSSSFIMDVLVAAKCSYVMLQAPSRQGNHYSRLVQIEKELRESGRLAYKRHVFQPESSAKEEEVAEEAAAAEHKD